MTRPLGPASAVRRACALAWLLFSPVLAAPAEQTAEQDLAGNLLAEGLILFGALFILAAALGMLRFPDFYTRLHASTKLVTLGGLGILGGASIAFSEVGSGERVLLIAAFFLLTAPLSGYMIAHAGYLSGLVPYREESSVDEWQSCGAFPAEKEGQQQNGRPGAIPPRQ